MCVTVCGFSIGEKLELDRVVIYDIISSSAVHYQNYALALSVNITAFLHDISAACQQSPIGEGGLCGGVALVGQVVWPRGGPGGVAPGWARW